MEPTTIDHKKRGWLRSHRLTVSAIILSLFCILAIWLFVFNTTTLYRSGELSPYHPDQKAEHRPPTIATIQTWMTFNYLNVVFNIPVDYLKNKFAITDIRYPNIRIDHYATITKQDPLALLKNIQTAISEYKNK